MTILDSDRVVPQYRIRRMPCRPSRESVKPLSGAATAPISDALYRRGCLPGEIHALYSPAPHIVGPAYTVQASPADQLLALYAIAHAQPGDVIVLAGTCTDSGVAWGGIMSAMAKKRGIAALVTDGFVRDLKQCEASGFPIYARGVRPLAPCKDVPPGDVNFPVAVGNVVIFPGDVIVADEDGVVVIPLDLVEDVVRALDVRDVKEASWLDRIASEDTVLFSDSVDQALAARATWIESERDTFAEKSQGDETR